MQSTRFFALLVVALMLCASTFGAPERPQRVNTFTSSSHASSVGRDSSESLAPFSNPDVDMDDSQVQALLDAAMSDMQTMASLWTRTNLVDACRTPNSPTGVLSCTDDGFPTVISVSASMANGAPTTDKPSPQLSNLAELTSLSITWGQPLSGPLPATWGVLTKLTSLTLAPNFLVTGSMPDDWLGMTSLSSLTLFFAGGTTPISTPVWIPNLVSVYLKGAYFGPGTDLPDSWFSSTSLTSLILEDVRWSGNVPEVMASNNVIQHLSLAQDSTGLNGAKKDIPSDLSAMTSLQTFVMRFHPTQSAFPSSWPLSLVSLTLANLPYLIGTIPQSLFDLPSLHDITLRSLVTVNGPLPGPSIPSSSAMVEIQVSSVALTEPISNAWFFTPSLLSMIVEGMSNSMAPFELGPFPPVDSGLCKLQLLSMGQIQLSGSLPAAFFSICPDLNYIDLSSNNLIGSIPTDWSKSNGVVQLILNNNRFTGSIPSGTKWKVSNELNFAVHVNSLTGSLPAGFMDNNWKFFDLESNEIDICSNLDTLPSSMQDCIVAQVSNANWCPCFSNWTDVGCRGGVIFGADCSVPSAGPSPLSELPPYTTGEPAIPPVYINTPNANNGPDSSSSPSDAPSTSSNPSTPLGPGTPTPSAANNPNTPTGAATSATLSLSVFIVSLVAVALFMH